MSYFKFSRTEMFSVLLCASFLVGTSFWGAGLKIKFVEAATDGPAEVIQAAVERAKKIVLEEKGKTPDDELRDKLEEVVFPVFDFREMARRALGPPWKRATREEQKEYIDLFSKLLSRSYYNKVVENIGDSTYSMTDTKVKGKKALVKSTVLYDGESVSINYRLRNKNSSWRVYDIIVENVSLVSNYRSEFGSIVRREKMSGLIQMLREKTAKMG